MSIATAWKFLEHIWKLFIFNDMNFMVDKGCKKQLNEQSVDRYYKDSFDSEYLSTQLDMKMKEIKQKMTVKRKDKTNILRLALWKLHYKSALLATFLYIFQSIIRFVSALLFEQLIKWFEDSDSSSIQGWILGIFYVSTTIFASLLAPHMYLVAYGLGLKIKLALLGLIHKKILKSNTAIISWQTTGQIVNFASSDLIFFEDRMYLFPYIISAPVDFIVSFILIGIRIGWLASFLGLSMMLIFTPFQGSLSGQVKKFKQKALTLADERFSAMSEMITGILAIKSFTWEKSIFSKIKFLRLKEQDQLFNMQIVSGISIVAYTLVLGFIPFATFTTVVLKGENFNVSSAFFILAIINVSRATINLLLPMSIAMYVQANVSLRRLNSFLTLEEPELLDRNNDISEPRGTIDAKIENFGWLVRIKENENSKSNELKRSLLLISISRDIISSIKGKSLSKEEMKLRELKTTKFLHNISFKIDSGTLIGIVGEVGSGKSSLLSALLGEMQDLSETSDIQSSNGTKLHKQMYGSVSYCAQSPWILSGTVKENILFGSELDEEWYEKVIKSCSLEMDLEQLPAGDMTELGERGVNLSGGQKARISLARAAYKKADVNLLDDPLSAVDPKVANTLFELCISNNGLMNGKTRVLVSHQVQFMNKCDKIIIMDSGKIVAMGTYDQLIESEYSQVFKRMKNTSDSESDGFDKGKISSSSYFLNLEKENSIEMQLKKENETGQMKSGKLVDKEKKEIGNISWRAYLTLFRYFGFSRFILALSLLLLFTCCLFISQFLIYEWADQEASKQDDRIWILRLGIMCLLLFIFGLSYSILNQRYSLISLTKLHLEMVRSVLASSLSFFHTNPSGRIINRFSKDQSVADNMLVVALNDFSQMFAFILGIMIVVCIALPYVSIIFPFYLYLVYKLTSKYLRASREVRRYDGITRSPIYETISENLKGMATIRAYGMENKFNQHFMPFLNRNGLWWICYHRLIRWFSIRLDIMSSCVLIISTFASIAVKGHINTEFVSVALLNTMSMLAILQYVVRHFGSLENSMTSFERLLEYTKLEKEPPTVEDGASPGPRGWPNKGGIVFNNVSSRYRKELDPVLNNLTFKIPAGTSVGIIGRTGSGKSSLLLTLYRLIEKIEGNIYLDGIDIESVGLDVLRKNLAIIPQDPILFEGSLRFNLDPWDQFSDEKLWEILNMVQLKDFIRECGGLDTQLSEGGNNFSVGQRQLLCLARALLKDAKVLSVDEATANVDNLTDSLVHSSIREFVSKKNENGEKYRTLFVIAHRIDTILDCDMLMIFDNGYIVEVGSPAELKLKSDGIFSSMLQVTNDLFDN